MIWARIESESSITRMLIGMFTHAWKSSLSRDNVQKLFEDGGGQPPDLVTSIRIKIDRPGAPPPAPVLGAEDFRAEEVGEGDFDQPFNLPGIGPEPEVSGEESHIGGHQIVMDRIEIVERSEDIHVFGSDPHLFPGFPQGGLPCVTVFRVAHPAG